jgi:Na+-driven multidrug efflux pump
MLAGIGLAKSIFEMLPACFAIGSSGALETLVSQSYGKKDYKKCGDYLNK